LSEEPLFSLIDVRVIDAFVGEDVDVLSKKYRNGYVVEYPYTAGAPTELSNVVDNGTLVLPEIDALGNGVNAVLRYGTSTTNEVRPGSSNRRGYAAQRRTSRTIKGAREIKYCLCASLIS
jgi:hypothetical protein